MSDLQPFIPNFEPSGDRVLTFTYFLDGRTGVVYQFPAGTYPNSVVPSFDQSLRGEYEVGGRYSRPEGIVMFGGQHQFIDRIRPKIKYSRGTSISFLMIDKTREAKCNFLGLGLEFTPKTMKKGKLVAK